MAETRKQKKAARAEAAGDAAAPAASTGPGSMVGLVGVAALVIGLAAGWFGRGASARGEASAAAAAAPAGSAGVCDGWASAVCARVGDPSEGCAQARGAASLLPDGACAAARADLDRTVARLKSTRSSCDTLVEKICADLGDTTETCKMVRDKTASFPADRCKDMLAHFDEVIGELRSVEKENAPLPDELARRQAAGDGPGFGPRDAKVTIVEYSDFECPFCGRAAEAVSKVKEKYGSRVRFVFRQFPLPMHRNADLAAQASLAAHAQGKFWPFHDQLFANQRELDRASLERYAQKAGLDMGKFRKALDDRTYADAVKADMQLGTEASVSGTPSMFIGNKRVDNATDADSLSHDIDEALASAR